MQDDATAAVEDYFDNEGWGGRWPDDGYRVEREGDDRVLLSWDVDQRTKVAFIVADGITDYRGDRGWGVETWAQCDAAELTEDELADLGVQIWEDADGHRIPTTDVTSFQGAEHCDWQDITFVMLGGERKGRQFLRDVDGELADLTRTTYDGSATLPDGARDTGYHREGREALGDRRRGVPRGSLRPRGRRALAGAVEGSDLLRLSTPAWVHLSVGAGRVGLHDPSGRTSHG